MTIKGRLILSYTAMLVIPIILVTATGAILRNYYWGAYRDPPIRRPGSRIESKHSDIGWGTLLRDLNRRTLENPDFLGEREFLKEMEGLLPFPIEGIAMRRDRKLIYVSDSLDNSDSLENLPGFGSTDREGKKPKIWIRSEPFQWDFYYKDGSRGSFFIFWQGMGFAEGFSTSHIVFPLVTILVLVLTNGFLTLIVSRSIMKPLLTLKAAAERIREGDLKSYIEYTKRDEFGEVTTAFEQMRIRLKNSIEKQVQYEENRRELIANISHDLRTPLTAIKGYVEGIRDGVADTHAKREKYLDTIYAKAVLLDRLIDELFFYSRLDLKRVPFNFEKIDIGSFIKETLQELISDYKNLSVDFNFEDAGPSLVIGDKVHLRRVISNLVENSVLYSDKGHTEIRISLESAEDFVTVVIKDNGPGIEREMLPLVFERFIRADPSRNAYTEGSGLGLAIARHIVEAHDGGIWAESDEGTVIKFTLKKVKQVVV